MKNLWKTIRLISLGVLCLAALYGYANAEGNLLGDGRDYRLAPGQLEYGGIYSSGATEDGGVIQCAADHQAALPRLYALPNSDAIAGVYARSAASEMIVSPSLTSGAMALDFLCIDEGASVDVRFWENEGEFGFMNTQNPATVICERADADGFILTCVTRSCLDGKTVTGDCAVYRSRSGVLRLTGNYKSVKAQPPADAAVVGSAQWIYETDTHRLTASALDRDGKYANIAYSVSVENAIALSGQGVATANGTVEFHSADDEWRLKIVFPETGEFQTPLYRANGEIAALCDAASFVSPFVREKAQEQAVPVSTPAPALPPQPIESAAVLPLPDPESPREIASWEIARFAGAGSPRVSVSVNRLLFTVEIDDLPAGMSLSRVNFTQVFSDGGFHMNMRNAYAVPCEFAAEEGVSRITLTVCLTDAQGRETSVNAGAFLTTAP